MLSSSTIYPERDAIIYVEKEIVDIVKSLHPNFFFNVADARLFCAFIIGYIYKFERTLAYSFIYNRYFVKIKC